jgi:hypothetical protein
MMQMPIDFLRKTKEPLDMASRDGMSEPLAWVVCLPAWWAFIGVCLVLGLWLWSMAVNVMALNQSGQALAVGLDGEGIRRRTLVDGLGGYASDFASAHTYGANERAIVSDVDRTVAIKAFPSPNSYVVQARVVVRQEQFYPWQGGGWE